MLFFNNNGDYTGSRTDPSVTVTSYDYTNNFVVLSDGSKIKFPVDKYDAKETVTWTGFTDDSGHSYATTQQWTYTYSIDNSGCLITFYKTNSSIGIIQYRE